MDHDTVAMENAVTEVMGGEVSYGGGLVSYLKMENSFNEIASATIFSDFSMIVTGFMIVFFYTSFMLGRFHMIENRVGWEFLVGTVAMKMHGVWVLVVSMFCYHKRGHFEGHLI